MQNDAKLGLLAGVAGVIVSAVVSMNRPQLVTLPSPKKPDPTTVQPAPATRPTIKPAPESSIPKPPADPVAPAVLPSDLSSTPVARTKREPDVTPASRTKYDDIDP